jgi:hypothetical protein
MSINPENAPLANVATEPPQYIREIDTFKAQEFQERIETEQNLVLGTIAGSAAALAGAILWAVITVVTNFQIGWMAIGVAFAVGWCMRRFGKGVNKIFGVVGAGLALLGCIAGNFFMIAALVAQNEAASIIDVIALMILNPVIALELFAQTFSPIDLLFYAFAIYYGYRFSFRQITTEEQESLYRTRTVAL